MKRLVFLLALLCASPLEAAWARVTSATLASDLSAGAIATWNVGTLGAAVSANNKIVAITMISDPTTTTVSSISDSLGNTWSKDLSTTIVDSTNHDEMAVWSTVTGGGTPSSMTLHYSRTLTGGGSSFTGAAFAAYSGLSTSTGAAGIDISKMSNGTATTADSGTATGTTGASSELKVGFYADDGNTSTLTAGTVDSAYSSFVKDDSNGNGQTMIEDHDSGTSGSSARAEVTTTGSPFWGMAVVVYKLAAAGGGCSAPPSGLTLIGVGNCKGD